MSNIIARVGIYGDIHLSSKNYGAHKDYPAESLYCFNKIAETCENKQLTHLICCGDFTFGRFHSLEYRNAVDQALARMHKQTSGNHFVLCGNHDVAGYGLVERDYYIEKGLIRPSQNMTLGNVNFTMVDYDKHETHEPNIIDSEDQVNILVTHDFFKFSNTQLPNYGKAIILDEFSKWFGADYIACGHVHKIINFSGYITKENNVHECIVHYLGCMTRPSFRDGHMDNVGQVLIFTIYDNGELDCDIENIPLWSLDDSFNLEVKQKQQAKKEEKAARVDISDVVKQLDSHDRNVGNPEDIIKGLTDIDEKYKNKAIELLKGALA